MSCTLEFMVDWDATDWTDTPDFSEAIDDITAYVKLPYDIDRGKNNERGNSPAGTLNVVLRNDSLRFSPCYLWSPLYGKMRPWLPVRVRGTVVGVGTYTIFTGFISKITVDPDPNVQEAILYCTDGTDLLARQQVTQDMNNRTTTSDGGALGKLLDAAGWPAGKRAIDTDGGNVVQWPNTVEF